VEWIPRFTLTEVTPDTVWIPRSGTVPDEAIDTENVARYGSRPNRWRSWRARWGNEPLFRNSLYLLVNLGLGAVTGFVFYALLAHLYPVREVGMVTALIAANSIVISFSGLGLNYSLVRLLPGAADKRPLLDASVTYIAISGLVVSTAVVLIPDASGHVLSGYLTLQVLFLCGGVVASLKAVGEVALISQRSAGKVLGSSIVLSVLRLAFPFLFTGAGTFGAYLSQVLATLAGAVVIFVYLVKVNQHRPRLRLRPMPVDGFWKLSFGGYVTGVVGGLPAMILPIIVIERLGAEESAYWSIAMLFANFVFMSSSAVSQALLPEGSANPAARIQLINRTVRVMCVTALPAAVLIFFLAPYVALPFGVEYARGTADGIRVLAISGLLVSGNYIAGAPLFFAKQIWTSFLANLVNAVVVLGLAATWARSVTDVAVSWLVGEVTNILILGSAAYVVIKRRSPEWLSST